MKPNILILITLLFINISCNKNNEISEPGLSIYKTTNIEYLNHTSCRVKDGEVVSYFGYSGWQSELVNRVTIENGDTIFSNRFLLDSNFIVDSEGDFIMAFTDLTLKEHMKLEREKGRPLTSSEIEDHLLDTSPFLEYYEERNPENAEFFNDFRKIDTARLNEIIKSGELEKYFIKK